MKTVKWDLDLNPEQLATQKGWAFFCIQGDSGPLLYGYTPNLAKRLSLILKKAEEENNYRQMSLQARSLQYEIFPQAMQALLRHKVYCLQNQPAFQSKILPWENYCYLALDAYRFPFVSMQSYTDDDWLYIGPWRSRFMLADVMDSLSRILKIPFCETGTFPCHKLDSQVCKGYCLALQEGLSQKAKPDLGKLQTLLEEAFTHPDNGILELVAKERDNYFNDLEFAKADLLNDEVEILKKYREWLEFLIASKSIALDGPDFSVEGGMLRTCNLDGKLYEFTRPAPSFRPNEKLALNLQDVDEAWIVYQHLKTNQGSIYVSRDQ